MLLGIPKRVLTIAAILAGVLFIYVAGADQRPSPAESANDHCRVTVTADILNLRAGPGLDAEIIGTYRKDVQTDAETVVRNGFRKLADHRWAADEFLEPVDNAHCD